MIPVRNQDRDKRIVSLPAGYGTVRGTIPFLPCKASARRIRFMVQNPRDMTDSPVPFMPGGGIFNQRNPLQELMIFILFPVRGGKSRFNCTRKTFPI